MKKAIVLSAILAMGLTFVSESQAAIKYIGGYTRSNGTYVSGHYRDTSNDGYSWNNANTLGLNGW